VFYSEVEALAFIRRQIPRGTELYADEAAAWTELHARYTLHRVNHEEAYSLGGEYEINTNSAESFFSRMRRGEIGHHHHVAGPYLIRSLCSSSTPCPKSNMSNRSPIAGLFTGT
jgi:hypothetical protein